MERQYDQFLVALSIGVATVAGYVALDLAGRLTVARGQVRRLWLAAGALAMGTGIWSMHFIGMLAFRLRHAGTELPMTYGVPELVLSVLVAVLASAIALAVVSREALPGTGHLLASLAMGAAIAGMHYIGMAGLRVPSRMHYDPPLVLASIAIAVVASFVALWLAFRLRGSGRGLTKYRLAASAIIGIAIAGMHYTAMTAARFTAHDPATVLHQGTVLATDGLGWAVTGTTALILGLALVGSALDRAFRARLAHTEEIQRLYAAAEEARADAERATQAKSAMLATMSHELRTPLNAIQGHVQLIQLGLHGPVTDAQREALGRVEQAQRHLLALINDVLNIARLQSGRLEYDIRRIALDDVLRDLGPMMEPLFLTKRIAFRIALRDDGQPVEVCADPDRLSQILLNLLSNAAKFTAEGGAVQVTLGDAPSPDVVALRVVDTGVGIPAEQLGRIFEPFVQLHRELWRESQQGTGLGLAISRDLARAMGGDLRAESEVGRGTTFILTLPRPAT